MRYDLYLDAENINCIARLNDFDITLEFCSAVSRRDDHCVRPLELLNIVRRAMVIMLVSDQDYVSNVCLLYFKWIGVNDFFACYFKGIMTEPVDVLYHCKPLLVRSEQKK